MEGMEAYPRAAVERAMKVQEVMLRAIARKITRGCWTGGAAGPARSGYRWRR
jgi:hypothetical protein